MLNITLARRTYKSYYDDETNLYVHKFDKEISKSANKTTKIARTVDETLLSAEINCSSKIFLIFECVSTKYFTCWYLVKTGI